MVSPNSSVSRMVTVPSSLINGDFFFSPMMQNREQVPQLVRWWYPHLSLMDPRFEMTTEL